MPETSVTQLESKILGFLYDDQHPGSLQSILAALVRVASVVRDRLSLDSWRILKRVDDDFQPGYPLGVIALADVLSMLNRMLFNFSAFSGVITENMTRGPGWQFLEFGRRVERALNMIGLMRSTLVLTASGEHAVFDAVLEIADSSMTYRSRYATNLQMVALLGLVADGRNQSAFGQFPVGPRSPNTSTGCRARRPIRCSATNSVWYWRSPRPCGWPTCGRWPRPTTWACAGS